MGIESELQFEHVTHDLRDDCDHCGKFANPIFTLSYTKDGYKVERRVRMCNECTIEFLRWL